MKTQIVGLGTFNGEQYFCNDFYCFENAFLPHFFPTKNTILKTFFTQPEGLKNKNNTCLRCAINIWELGVHITVVSVPK
jgi:hypothetical protein